VAATGTRRALWSVAAVYAAGSYPEHFRCWRSDWGHLLHHPDAGAPGFSDVEGGAYHADLLLFVKRERARLPAGATVSISGHSLGGGLATIVAGAGHPAPSRLLARAWRSPASSWASAGTSAKRTATRSP